MTDAAPAIEPDEAEIDAFWQRAKVRAKLSSMPGYFGPGALESVQPPVWWFGGTPEQATSLLALVLDGVKTATASALWDYEATGEPVPERGSLGIVLDGSGHPHALVGTIAVEVVPFSAVSAEHARLEGEGDLSLAYWREVHEHALTEHAAHDRGFSPDMPVVLERFEVLYQD